MKIALSTVSLPSFAWKDCLAQAAAAGYRHVELLMIPGWDTVPHPGEIEPAELAAEAAKRGLDIASLHAGALDGASDASIAETAAYVRRLAAFARDAGVPLVNANGGRKPDDGSYTADERRRVLGRISSALGELGPWFSRHGRRLTLENHFGYQLETAEDYAEVLGRVPESAPIGVTVDTGHFTAARVDMPAFVRRFGRRVFHVHIKDHVGEKSVPLGEGHTDNAAVVAALAAQGYDGYLSVELEVHDGREIEHVRAALPYMRALISGVAPATRARSARPPSP